MARRRGLTGAGVLLRVRGPRSRMFSKILIANRGEIAVRIIKTCRRMGIETVVVYSEADADSPGRRDGRRDACSSARAPAAQSYLVADKIIAACSETGAEAVHPGFGFLSENAGFAQRCADEGIVFIGPNPHAIEAMGDKIESQEVRRQGRRLRACRATSARSTTPPTPSRSPRRSAIR